jgi:UDP-glucose 4-epimerase
LNTEALVNQLKIKNKINKTMSKMKFKELKNKKVVVTGGAGFIGSNIARKLLELGAKVTVIDNLSTGRISNIKDILPKIRFVKKSITDINLLKKELKNAYCIFHEAAIPSVQRSVEDPVKTNDSNINGTLCVLMAAKEAGARRVVYAASSSSYGNQPKLPKVESMRMDPMSPYAIQKLTGEYYCKVFYEIFGVETIALKYFNVFGPRQDPNSMYSAVIPLFVKSVLKNKQPTIFGDGLQSRDFSHVDNVVEANLLAATTKNKNAFGKTVNIACGERINLIQMLRLINKLEGKNVKPKFAEDRKGDVKHSLADIKLAKKLIDYNPVVNFEQGIRKTIEWYKNY